MPAQAVAETAADESNKSGGAVLQAVDETELERREPDAVEEVERQHRRHHLGGQVGEEARDPEQDHRPPNAPPADRGTRILAVEQDPGALSLIHEADTMHQAAASSFRSGGSGH